MKILLKFILLSFAVGLLTFCTIDNPYNQFSIDYPLYNLNTGDPSNPENQNPTQNPRFQGPKNPVNPSERVLDFPYELIPDTVTALTCPTNNFFPKTNYPRALVLGSYKHGLRLSQSFIKSYNITEGTPPERVLQFLQSSPFRSTRARLAVHGESDLRVIFGRSKDQPLHKFFPPFDNPSTLKHLSERKPVIASRSSSPIFVETGGRFEAFLPITGKELRYGLAIDLDPDSPEDAILALTYSLDDKEDLILSDSGQPYGRGYKLKFAYNNYRNAADYLTDVIEVNLSTTEIEGDWTCPRNLVLPVHRAEDEESSTFNQQYDRYSIPEGIPKEGYCHTRGNINLSGEENYFFGIVFGDNPRVWPFKVGKTVLRGLGGNLIGTDESCIVFTGNNPGCYQGGFYRIEFDRNNDCFPFHTVRSDGDLHRRFHLCPAFLSVCFRDIN